MKRSIVVFVAALSGCLTQENFPERVTLAACERLQECDASVFDTLYDSTGDCRDDSLDVWEEGADCLIEAGCAFDAEAASECIAEVREGECGDLTDLLGVASCAQAYDCGLTDLIDAGACVVF